MALVIRYSKTMYADWYTVPFAISNPTRKARYIGFYANSYLGCMCISNRKPRT